MESESEKQARLLNEKQEKEWRVWIANKSIKEIQVQPNSN